MNEDKNNDEEKNTDQNNGIHDLAWLENVIQKPGHIILYALIAISFVLIIYLFLSGGTIGSFAQWGQP